MSAKKKICCPDCSNDLNFTNPWLSTAIRELFICPHCNSILQLKFKYGMAPRKVLIGFVLLGFAGLSSMKSFFFLGKDEYDMVFLGLFLFSLMFYFRKNDFFILSLLKSIRSCEIGELWSLKGFKAFFFCLCRDICLLIPFVAIILLPLIMQKNTLSASLLASFGAASIMYGVLILLSAFPVFLFEKGKILRQLNIVPQRWE